MSKTVGNFQGNLDELESIVEWFESSDVDLDQAIEKFERGLALAAELKGQLDTVENKVTEIKRKFEASGGETDSPTDSDSSEQ